MHRIEMLSLPSIAIWYFFGIQNIHPEEFKNVLSNIVCFCDLPIKHFYGMRNSQIHVKKGIISEFCSISVNESRIQA